jgi:glyoxylase I family protein
MSETTMPKKLDKMEVKRILEEKYPHQEALLKRIECIYIPVTNAAVTKEFFMKHKLITINKKGNVKLASGQGIFFLETKVPYSTNFQTPDWDENNENYEIEGFCFEVEHIHELYMHMSLSDAVVRELKDFAGCGYGFIFKDPDGNKYAAWQQSQ